MNLELRSALHFGFDALAEAFNASFEGYFVTMKFDAASLESRTRAETWDLGSSFIARRGSETAGVLFISRRGRSARVAGMGVTAPHRRTGVGRALMDRCIADSRARGDTRMVLEVLEKNIAAVALYEGVGFLRLRRLVGYERAAFEGAREVDRDFTEIDLAELATRAYAGQDPNLPWQIDAATLANLSPPARAFALGDRAAALIFEAPDRFMLRAIVVAPQHRRAGHGSALLMQLAAKFPGRTWSVPVAVPEGFSEEFFLARGFTRGALTQWEMCTAR
jgi:ribosomal protein S18 acetylase RimI-like enzyme